jgi:hypothetical protein
MKYLFILLLGLILLSKMDINRNQVIDSMEVYQTKIMLDYYKITPELKNDIYFIKYFDFNSDLRFNINDLRLIEKYESSHIL